MVQWHTLCGQIWASASTWLLSLRGQKIVVLLLLAMQAGLLSYSATRHSPTHLEPALLASGVANWQLGRFELYRVNPPLIRMVAALPVLAAGCKTDWRAFTDEPGQRPEYALGDDFLKANGPASVPLLIYARFACIPFSLIGAVYAYRWAGGLYGPTAAYMALVLYIFEPNLLAHGELITSDAACTSFGIVAGFYFWSWLRLTNWTNTFLAGVALGLAILSKMSWLILLPLWPALWLCWMLLPAEAGHDASVPVLPSGAPASAGTFVWSEKLSRFAGMPNKGFQLAAMYFIAVYVINCAYAFDGVFTPYRDLRFVSRWLSNSDSAATGGNRLAESIFGRLPVPVPTEFLRGLDTQLADFDEYVRPSYLMGQWKGTGWWYYYAYGMLVKLPGGTLALILLVAIQAAISRHPYVVFRDELVLLAPLTLLFLIVSSQTAFSIHFRYVLPSLGLTLIFASRAFSLKVSEFRLKRILPFLLVFCTVAESTRAYPHHLSFFNVFVGGNANGYKHLLGSSVDWGQDWIVLWGSEFDESLTRQTVRVTGYVPFWKHCCFTQSKPCERYADLASIDDVLSMARPEPANLTGKRWLSPTVVVLRDQRGARSNDCDSF